MKKMRKKFGDAIRLLKQQSIGIANITKDTEFTNAKWD